MNLNTTKTQTSLWNLKIQPRKEREKSSQSTRNNSKQTKSLFKGVSVDHGFGWKSKVESCGELTQQIQRAETCSICRELKMNIENWGQSTLCSCSCSVKMLKVETVQQVSVPLTSGVYLVHTVKRGTNCLVIELWFTFVSSKQRILPTKAENIYLMKLGICCFM